MEAHCHLVSESGIVRTDLGIEFMRCSKADGRTEAELRARRKRPRDWQLTGEGFIIRLFMNEITTTLDINWFSVSPCDM
jgi:hypothetical protein